MPRREDQVVREEESWWGDRRMVRRRWGSVRLVSDGRGPTLAEGGGRRGEIRE